MMKFLGKVAVMLFILILSGIAVTLFMRDKMNNYLGASSEKQYLLENSCKPSLILVGGSNVAFGFDSKYLERALGIEVLNMGLHSDLGLRYMLNEVKRNIVPGDLIVLSPEYEQLFGEVEPNGRTLTQLVLLNPAALRLLSFPDDLFTFISHLYLPFKSLYSYYIAGFTNNDSIYSKDHFNENGDFIIPRNAYQTIYQPAADRSLPGVDEINDEAIALLNQFFDFAQKRGAHVWLSFPPVPGPEYERMKSELDGLAAALEKRLKLPLISEPDDYVFPSENFYDTKYHLNAAGRVARTRQLAMDIAAHRQQELK